VVSYGVFQSPRDRGISSDTDADLNEELASTHEMFQSPRDRGISSDMTTIQVGMEVGAKFQSPRDRGISSDS
jgi:hypothetical protein